MQFAVGPDGDRIEAIPAGRARCPLCGEPMYARCGEIRVHHWAHESGQECDGWFEPETVWHRNWKLLFPPECVEVAFLEHRADICLAGLVVELQNSSIGPQEIQERERFYGRRMVWVVNGSSFANRFFLMKAIKPGLFSFRWKHMKPTWRFAQRPVILDFGDLAVRDLLGAKVSRFTDSITLQGVREPIERKAIERLSSCMREEAGMYQADSSLESIPTEILGRRLFRINTLHENGWGSGIAVDKESLIETWKRALN